MSRFTCRRPSRVPALHGLVRAGIALLLLSASCSTAPAPRALSSTTYPVGYQERGFASWYGPGFHGQKTANGERYDMHQLTAAHRTLPLGSVVSVHSVRTGRDVVVRINDRGPFVRDRVIDLSLSAAKAIEMLGPGTDEVTLHVVSYQERPEGMGPLRIQVASFAEKANAVALVNRLSARYRGARVVTVELREGTRYRVQIGEYAREQEAAAAAKQVDHQLNVSSFIVREDP